MTTRTEQVKKRARSAEEATIRAIEDSTGRIRSGLRDGATAARKAAPRAKKAVARGTLLDTMKQLPNYLRLLCGLFTDRRVSNVDKLLVAAALAYVASPIDFIPDWIPFLGQVDDVFLVVTALQRLITNAGRRVVRSYWTGSMHDLEEDTLARVISAAVVFLPRGIRRKLRSVRGA